MIPGVHHRFRLFRANSGSSPRRRSAASLAPTLGPTVGGWITENYNWHWLFFINVVPGIYIAVAVPLLVK